MPKWAGICKQLAPGRGLEPLLVESKSTVLPLDDPGRGEDLVRANRRQSYLLSASLPDYFIDSFCSSVWIEGLDSLACEACHRRGPMGSLIKKRRKRMRKKKHKKMLRRTRHQRQRK